MKLAVAVGLACLALMATSSSAEEFDPQRVTLDYFPYCVCQNGTLGDTAYKLDPKVIFKGNNTYCFKVIVNIPPNCDHYCCRSADLNKLEFDVNPECKVAGQQLAGTVNGRYARPVPTIEKSVDADTNTFIFKFTGMGLNLTTANNSEICIYLGPNRAGNACTSLNTVCKPPPGAPPGVCRTALFDSKVACCPLTDVNVPSPSPPPSPQPPSPPPPPPPCRTCIRIDVSPLAIIQPYNFSLASCQLYASEAIADLTTQAAALNASISTPFALSECKPEYITICGAFASDADGALLQTWAANQVLVWVEQLTDKTSQGGVCNEEFQGYAVRVSIEGDCLAADASTSCIIVPGPPDFPKCACNRNLTSLVFQGGDTITELPGRFDNVTLFCFDISTVDPATVRGPCKSATTLLKIEFFANERFRRQITATAVKPAGASSYKYLAASWGAFGESTYKASPLNWGLAEANGGQVCLELAKPLTIFDFCLNNVLGVPSRCWFSLFDTAKKCCPLTYSTTA